MWRKHATRLLAEWLSMNILISMNTLNPTSFALAGRQCTGTQGLTLFTGAPRIVDFPLKSKVSDVFSSVHLFREVPTVAAEAVKGLVRPVVYLRPELSSLSIRGFP